MADTSALPPTRVLNDQIPAADPNNLGAVVRLVNGDAEWALLMAMGATGGDD